MALSDEVLSLKGQISFLQGKVETLEKQVGTIFKKLDDLQERLWRWGIYLAFIAGASGATGSWLLPELQRILGGKT